MAKTVDFTHVQVSKRNRKRAKEVARKLAARENREVPYCYLLDGILDKGLAEYETELGIKPEEV